MSRDPKLQALYGLKFNPFLPDIPVEALHVPLCVEAFISGCERQLPDGGFAQLTGPPGVGKSATLRLLQERLGRLRDVMVRSITYPQCRLGDLYREIGDAFGVSTSWSNRWGSFKTVREKWLTHLETTHTRPVLIVDEAQESLPTVLRELRLLMSRNFDSQSLLFVVLAGDLRLADTLRHPDLLPLDSRIRTRGRLDALSPDELQASMQHVLETAGNTQLLSPGALSALAEHALGNQRAMMIMANELLHAAVARDARQLDEKLFFEIFAVNPPKHERKRR